MFPTRSPAWRCPSPAAWASATRVPSLSAATRPRRSVPGIYSQITVSGNASLTFKPGVYILAGGGLTVSGNASLSGSGVMLFNAGSAYNAATGSDGGTYGSITLSGNGTDTLSAPTTGTYAGILIFQDRNNSRALTLSGNATLGTSGTIYAPLASLTLSGNAQSGTSQQANDVVHRRYHDAQRQQHGQCPGRSAGGHGRLHPGPDPCSLRHQQSVPGRHRPDHRHRRCLRRPEHLPGPGHVRQPVRAHLLGPDAVRPVRPGSRRS